MVLKKAIKNPLMSTFLNSDEGLKKLEELAEKHKILILLFVNNKIVNLKGLREESCELTNELMYQRPEVNFFNI